MGGRVLQPMLTIDNAERRRGQETGRPQVKFATARDLLKAARRFPGR
jgi:ferredoxin--NADP+ reductase